MTKADQLLLQRLKQGDDKAVTNWYRQFEPQIFRFICAKVSNLPDAQELTQDTFLHCLQHLPFFRGEASILTWMRQIALRRVASYYRKKYAKKIIRTLPLGKLVLAAPIYGADETSKRVKLVLQEMSAKSVELLKLKYIDQKSVLQIAIQMNKSIKAIESELFRTRLEFKRLWLEFNYEK